MEKLGSWLVDYGKRGPEFLILILLLGGSGVNLSKTDSIGQRINDFHTRLTMVEYRVNQLEEH